jgi:O-antigen/teichoic acid export membrane protein
MSVAGKLFHGMAWSAIERISVQAASFVIGIILARLLTPTEYGTIGILLVFISISQVFVDSGFTKALIQRKNRTEEDISTVFVFNFFIALCCYGVLYLLAPFIAGFYAITDLSLLLRILAISLVINALFTVPITLYSIALDFKVLAKMNLLATILSGMIAVYLAYAGFGVWALVAQTLIRSAAMAIIVYIHTPWKPSLVFSKNSFKILFAFGSNLLVSSLLNTTVNRFYELVIAKINSAKDLGIYSRGTQFTDVIFGIISTVLDRVLLPGLSEIQDQKEVLVEHSRKIIKMTSVLIVPIFFLLAIIAEPLIRLLLTDKWLPAVPIMQIFCFARLITVISGINVNLLYVLGRTDLALKQQLVKIIVRVVFLLAALPFGIVYIAMAELASTIVHYFINTHYPGKIMQYGATLQIRDNLSILLSGVFMGLGCLGLSYFLKNDLFLIVFSPLIGLPIYYVSLRLLKVKEFDLLWLKVRNFIKTK